MARQRAQRRFTFDRYLAAFFVLVALAIGAVFASSYALIRREEAAWARVGQPLQDVKKRWPRRDESPAARELDRLAETLGLSLTAPQAGTTPRSTASFRPLARSLDDLVGDDAHCGQPAPETATFLDTHRTALAAIAAQLEAGAAVTWSTDIEAGSRAPMPNLRAHLDLNALLLLEAMERRRHGDAAGAEGMVQAAWRHVAALRARPEIASLLLAVNAGDRIDAVLRCPPAASGEWAPRLQPQLRREIIDRFQMEAYAALRAIRSGPRGSSLPFGWAAAEMSRQVRRAREVEIAVADPCRGVDEVDDAPSHIPGWGEVTHGATSALARASVVGALGDLEAELTRLVVELRRASPPPSDAFAVRSRVCPGLSWMHTRSADSRWTISAQPEPAFGRTGRKPWTYTLALSSPP